MKRNLALPRWTYKTVKGPLLLFIIIQFTPVLSPPFCSLCVELLSAGNASPVKWCLKYTTHNQSSAGHASPVQPEQQIKGHIPEQLGCTDFEITFETGYRLPRQSPARNLNSWTPHQVKPITTVQTRLVLREREQCTRKEIIFFNQKQ